MLKLDRDMWMVLFSISIMWRLATPDNGTGYSNNKMMCSDGKIAYCKDATEQFE